MSKENKRPHIPSKVQKHLWLRAGGRCEFRGCNRILYEDNITKDPINEANIAHIVSWTETGPRGDRINSPRLAINIDNLMLTCPEHNHLIDSKENEGKYTVALLQEMKAEHEQAIRRVTDLATTRPKRVIELKSLIHGQRPFITEKEEADALFPFYPKANRIIIDLCDITDLETAKKTIDQKIDSYMKSYDGSELFAAFIMAQIPLGCYLGYAIGNKVPVQTFQHFRDTETWIWRECSDGFITKEPKRIDDVTDVNLVINVSGLINMKQVPTDCPTYTIEAVNPGFNFLQAWEQVVSFRRIYREMLDHIRCNHDETVTIHLFTATPNPINFEIGKGIMKNLDPTIILYDKVSDSTDYQRVMILHERIRNKNTD